MIKLNKFFAAVGTGLLLSACQDMPLYEKSFSFADKTWSQTVKPKFRIDIKDTSKYYDFILTVRTTTDYDFNNLWIFLNTQTPSGAKGREPFEIKIQNEDGTWAGKKTGTIVEFPLTFKSKKMPEKGIYTFTVEQAVTQSKITELLDITYKAVEVNEKTN
ncbi:MAG: gliding motility lipoprotein GldH [Bacteroidota bacterium]